MIQSSPIRNVEQFNEDGFDDDRLNSSTDVKFRRNRKTSKTLHSTFFKMINNLWSNSFSNRFEFSSGFTSSTFNRFRKSNISEQSKKPVGEKLSKNVDQRWNSHYRSQRCGSIVSFTQSQWITRRNSNSSHGELARHTNNDFTRRNKFDSIFYFWLQKKNQIYNEYIVFQNVWTGGWKRNYRFQNFILC